MDPTLFQYCPKIVVFRNDEQEVLLARRSGEQDYNATYSFIGGKSEVTDGTLIEALQREKNEEVGEQFKIRLNAAISWNIRFNKKVVAVYQPHQNIRQHEILNENGYKHCFDDAAMVYWLPTYLSREYQDLPILSATDLMANTDGSVHTEPAEMNELLEEKIRAHLKAGDLVLGMAAGDLDHWLRSISW